MALKFTAARRKVKFHSAKRKDCAEFCSIKRGERRFGVKFCGEADLKFKLSTSGLKFKKLGGRSKPRRIKLGVRLDSCPHTQNALRILSGFKISAWSEQNFKIFTQMSRILKFLR